MFNIYTPQSAIETYQIFCMQFCFRYSKGNKLFFSCSVLVVITSLTRTIHNISNTL